LGVPCLLKRVSSSTLDRYIPANHIRKLYFAAF